MNPALISRRSVYFKSSGLQLAGVVYAPADVVRAPAVLFLHGGGTAGKSVNVYSQECLAHAGYASLAFDFRGVGESEGKFEEGSLENRLKDSLQAIEFIKTQPEFDFDTLCISGSSMGAHIAARLVEYLPQIPALNLVCAAAYGPQAEDKLLNEDFSQVIRRVGSWSGSLAFESLKKYTGAVSVIYGELDDVIPKEVQTEYSRFVTRPEYFKIIKNGKHQLNRPTNDLENIAREELETSRLLFLKRELTAYE